MANEKDLDSIFDSMADNDLAVASERELAEAEPEGEPIEDGEQDGEEPAIEADAPVVNEPAITTKPVADKPVEKTVAQPAIIGIPGITDAKDEQTATDDDDGEAAALKNPHSPEAKAFQKARKRAQKAEQEALELRGQLEALKSAEQTTSTETVNSGDVDIEDDDYVQGSQVKTMISGVEKRIEAKIRAELEAKEADRRVKDFEQRTVSAAEQFSKVHPDFAVRMQLAKTIMPFNEDERKSIIASINPAEAAYNIIGEKQKLFQTAIGITSPVNNTSPVVNAQGAQSKTETNNNDGFSDNDAAFRAFLG